MSEKESLLFLGRSSFWIFKPWLSQFGLSPIHRQHHQLTFKNKYVMIFKNLSRSSKTCHGPQIRVMIFKYMSWLWTKCLDLKELVMVFPKSTSRSHSWLGKDDGVQWNHQQRCSLTWAPFALHRYHSLDSLLHLTYICTALMQCVSLIAPKNANTNIINIHEGLV